MKQEDLFDFRRQMRALNRVLKEKYEPLFGMSKAEFKRTVEGHIGTFTDLARLREDELHAMGNVAGVDGSVARAGGAHPHYIELFQGLALAVCGEEHCTRRTYTPVLTEDDAVSADKIHDRYLAEVELEAAIGIIEETDVRVVIMDGGLLRYRINSRDTWEELRSLCIERDVLLVGAIKDIKTRDIAERTGKARAYYDREILAGKLERGELLILSERAPEEAGEMSKEAAGLTSGFYRPTDHWEVVGLDVLREQREHLVELARLLYTLTPRKGRGVPFWIDVVDERVKVSPGDIRLLMEESIDRDIMERFFVSERDRRV
ncbi:MAG: DNA double-strand break repair nuclease NurA [Peptoniphilus sp.]|nr:DNA double-strand break repair nuclease NurA [Peptoniphilus sp.]MDD7363230.1 DNA double-strand break repair nuclease NurA [Bacillota bacterium]MDY6044446.1 DNA double-strand break repair nuclease NurA [Peptoniphilus sp.]